MRFTKRDAEKDADKAIEQIKGFCGTLICLGRKDLAVQVGEASVPFQEAVRKALGQLSGEKVRKL
jgi:hypothetical protein